MGIRQTYSVTSWCQTTSDKPPVLQNWVWIPSRLTILVIKHPLPCQLQRRWQGPHHLWVVQPDSDEMPLAIIRICWVRESFSSVQIAHIIDEADISPLHRDLKRICLRLIVDGIKCFCLTFGNPRDTFSPRSPWCTCEDSSREVEHRSVVACEI